MPIHTGLHCVAATTVTLVFPLTKILLETANCL